MTAAIEPVANLTRRVEDLELARTTYRKHTVLAVYPLTSSYDADVEGVGRVNGFTAPAHFLPKVGDVFNLPLKGSVPGFEPNRIAPGAVGEEELAGYITENITVALGAANGKNKFWFSPNAPTTEVGSAVGDSWMRRDNVTRVITGTWEWDGDSWEPVTYGDQVLSSLTVGKLVGGTGTFDLIVGGRIATANTGQRAELNPLGFQGFNASNVLTINLDGVNNLITGRYMTAQSGRRIEVGSSGQSGAITFTSDTGTVARVQAFTASLPAAGTEALSMSVPVANTYGAWNSLQIQSNEQAYLLTGTLNVNYGGSATGGAFIVSQASNKGTTSTAPTLNPRFRIDEVNGTRFWDDGNRLRMQLSNAGGWSIWDGNDTGNTGDKRITVEDEFTIIYNPAGPNSSFNGQGQIEVQRTQTVLRGNPNADGDSAYISVLASGAAAASARLAFTNRIGQGGLLKYYNLASDAAGQRMEVRNNFDTVFIPIWATSFVVNSDRSTKADIRTLTVGATEQMAKLKPRRYTRKGDRGMPDVEQLGFVTDEMPAELVVGDPASGNATGIDVMALLATVVGAAQDMNARLTALENGAAK